MSAVLRRRQTAEPVQGPCGHWYLLTEHRECPQCAKAEAGELPEWIPMFVAMSMMGWHSRADEKDYRLLRGLESRVRRVRECRSADIQRALVLMRTHNLRPKAAIRSVINERSRGEK